MAAPSRLQEEIYDKPSFGRVYPLFNLTAQPMQRLLLIDFKGDPHYRSIELQHFDDASHGQGLLVILYRQDRKVDVYYEPGVRVDQDSYAIEAGLGAWQETTMEKTRFDVTPHGAQVEVAMNDAQGRHIEVLIREQEGGRPRKPFPLLAPISAAIEKPQQFLLVFLFDFFLVRRRGTDIGVTIDGEARAPALMPVPIDGASVYMARYSSQPFITEWNKAHDGPIVALEPPGPGEFQVRGTTYTLVKNGDPLEVASISAGDGIHRVEIELSPPMPNVVSLKNAAAIDGRFSVTVSDAGSAAIHTSPFGNDDRHEVCSGLYWVAREGDQVYITLRITKGWQARVDTLALRLLYLLRRSFKNWPKTYVWSARIHLAASAEPVIQSGWTRS